jgi:hypothetical protein
MMRLLRGRMQRFLPEPEKRRDIMDHDSMNDRASAALGSQTRELTEAELDAVSGGSSGGDRPSETMVSSYQCGGHGVTAIIAVL